MTEIFYKLLILSVRGSSLERLTSIDCPFVERVNPHVDLWELYCVEAKPHKNNFKTDTIMKPTIPQTISV